MTPKYFYELLENQFFFVLVFLRLIKLNLGATLVLSALLGRVIDSTIVLPEVDYLQSRATLLHDEEVMGIGGNLTLDRNERIANQLLMDWKNKEIERGILNILSVVNVNR